MIIRKPNKNRNYFSSAKQRAVQGQIPVPAMSADMGMVIIQAHTKLMVTPQRTADTRLVKPTPMIEPVIVCVVETGMPKCSVSNNVTAAPVSALTPSNGVILVILVPIVLTIFHPPDIVPNAIAE